MNRTDGLAHPFYSPHSWRFCCFALRTQLAKIKNVKKPYLNNVWLFYYWNVKLPKMIHLLNCKTKSHWEIVNTTRLNLVIPNSLNLTSFFCVFLWIKYKISLNMDFYTKKEYRKGWGWNTNFFWIGKSHPCCVIQTVYP